MPNSRNDKLADSRKQAARERKLLDFHLRIIEECESRGMTTATLQEIMEVLGPEEYKRLTEAMSEDSPEDSTLDSPPQPVQTAFKDARAEAMTALFSSSPEFQFVTAGTLLAIYPEDGFWAIRGKAIQAYATLEQSLCNLFSHLSGIPRNLAGIVFFRIIKSDTARGMLQELMRKKYQTKYSSSFSNSFWEKLRLISDKRNQIVHWNVIHTANTNMIMMIPPDMSGFDPKATKPITGEDCIEFVDRCLFITRHITIFIQIHQPESQFFPDQAMLQTLRDIFSRPIIYPPPHNHPLYRNAKVSESPPPPSPP